MPVWPLLEALSSATPPLNLASVTSTHLPLQRIYFVPRLHGVLSFASEARCVLQWLLSSQRSWSNRPIRLLRGTWSFQDRAFLLLSVCYEFNREPGEIMR